MGRFEDCLSEASSAETPLPMRANRMVSRPELSATDTGEAKPPGGKYPGKKASPAVSCEAKPPAGKKKAAPVFLQEPLYVLLFAGLNYFGFL